MPRCCSAHRPRLFLTLLAVVGFVAVLFVILIANWPKITKPLVISGVVFRDGSEEMDRFKTTADLTNLRLTFSVYNVTNAAEVVGSSAKIQVQEVGPFVYHEYKTKEFLENNQETGQITYKLLRRFTFKPELSVGDPKTMSLTWINVPVISAAAMIDKMNAFLRVPSRIALNGAISSFRETPFITDSVENFLFTGSYRKVFTAPLLSPFVPEKSLQDKKFALLYKRNDTWNSLKDYILTVSAGFGTKQTHRDLNQYLRINGSSKLSFWGKGGDCNDVRGTDGQFFNPFVEESQTLEVYAADICRRLPLKFREKVTLDGISAYKFTLDEKSFQSPKNNPENACYCLGPAPTNCQLDGLVDLSTCIADDVFASGSHFLYGPEEFLTRVDGVNKPEATKDEPFFYIEPNTGLAIQVYVPVQINVKIKKSDSYPIFRFFKDNDPLIVPLARITEAAELTEEQGSMLRNKLMLLDQWFMSMALGGVILLIIVIITVISLLCGRGSSSQDAHHRAPSESDPLLRHSNHRRSRARGHSSSRHHSPRR